MWLNASKYKIQFQFTDDGGSCSCQTQLGRGVGSLMVGHMTWSQTCFLTLPGRKEIKMQKRTKNGFWLLWSLPKNLALMQARTRQTRRWLRGSPVVIVISEAIVSQNHELPHYPRCPVPGRDNQSSGHQQQPYTCHNNTNYHASHNFSTLHSGKTGTPQHHRRIDS